MPLIPKNPLQNAGDPNQPTTMDPQGIPEVYDDPGSSSIEEYDTLPEIQKDPS